LKEIFVIRQILEYNVQENIGEENDSGEKDKDFIM